ncbi:hypothetical protein PQQ52_19185 [Paraburkholderia sediminicola]|uniref:hypothetical protein n=1 Tax=Paraburkholderia sediminicola TaxID=458836 RepID=UPI0038B72776
MANTAMTHRDEHPADAAAPRITVRAASGQLRIIQVWQALGQYATQAMHARVHCSRKHDFDEMTVTFEAVSPAALADIAQRLSAQPWVVAASLHTVPTSPPRRGG